MHVLLVIAMGSLGQNKTNEGVIYLTNTFFLATFLTSIFSAAFGMTKLLKVGPCSIVPRNKYGPGFFLVFLSIIFGLAGKGLLLGSMVGRLDDSVRNVGIGICFGTCYLAPMAYVSKVCTILTMSKIIFAKYLPFFVY